MKKKRSNNPAGREPRADVVSTVRMSAAATPDERDRWNAAHALLGRRVSDTIRTALEAVAIEAEAAPRKGSKR